jgi:hypothetical protein
MPPILEFAEAWAKTHSHLIDTVDVLFSFFIGFGLFWVAHRANGIAVATQNNTKRRLQSYQKKL